MIAAFLLIASVVQSIPSAPPPQASRPATSLTTTQTAPPSDDIVVKDVRDLGDDGPVTGKTLGSGRTGGSAINSRRIFELAERFARCAVTPRPKGAAELRGALDDTINSARQAFQQSRFVQLNASCAQDPGIAQQVGVATAGSNFDTRYYDRGAMFVQALRVYTPDLVLTKQQTGDPAVQAGFNAREVPLARFRLPADRTYFETAICLVRLQPELAVRLAKAGDYSEVTRLEAAIVGGARVCTGNAKKVYFDPMQFRFYIADAVYRWAVAARGINSLIL